MSAAEDESCTWCGTGIDPGDCFRVYQPSLARRAVFCRLEHIVPWEIKGPSWEAGGAPPDDPAADQEGCAAAGCEAGLPDSYLLLVRHRGPHEVIDRFCGTEHFGSWARKGGRWAL